MTDPRDTQRALKRDLEAGAWIGLGYEVAQYQLHEAVFFGKSPVVVSRFTKRWRDRGYLAVERWNRIGMNRLRLTSQGRELLVRQGSAKPEDIFVPAKPVAPKDLAHRLWINDLRVVLGRDSKFDVVLPAWSIERRFVPRLAAIPDVLAVSRGGASCLAVEVDLGGEPLRSVFVPKLAVLQGVLREVSSGGAILVLTSSERRRDAIADGVSDFESSVPIAVDVLPRAGGREGLLALSAMFTPNVNSTERLPADNQLQVS